MTVIVDCWCGELGAIRTGAKAHATPDTKPSFGLAS
jgi:hypothetical protein